MKFLGGFITGVIVTFLGLFLLFKSSQSDVNTLSPEDSIPGLLMFPEKGECLTKSELKIFQTIKPNMALAEFGEFPNTTLVLLVNYNGKSYYDSEKIQVPPEMCARQIGTYQYETKMEIHKTVPVVSIE
ncbi:hypothetical protein [Fulvivirga sedimenti]|uniref:Uncharacterized protein n=1 Tax=Fulvivirga sedimenti TaxID=2879465 RepID=A0A9X1HPZ4_9BACT|nr:hypothetical protein [Fulvivirga sedimenti]MCA6074633.1 hypothetical protein [Fulvivirga sedimenti]MCA6075810.1 hypothetical protein [Fulvivirga sedimenti]MCA6076938.1 hypothetical protein [Fulvivirga sedimenti]